MSDIPTWTERCEKHPDHQQGMVTHGMIQQRMQEEIDDLWERLAGAQAALLHFRLALNHSAPTVCDYLDKDHAAAIKAAREAKP
jgi:hypothetical protein